MLEAVVVEGTGTEARVPGYRVAGKTGTAQRAVNGSFDDIHHVAWFAGFLPQPDPQIVIVVAVEEPAVDFWGSTVAAPAFARIAEAATCYLGLPPAESSTEGEAA
jgi:cell division protein FtsI/penicillin-binding protein 2